FLPVFGIGRCSFGITRFPNAFSWGSAVGLVAGGASVGSRPLLPSSSGLSGWFATPSSPARWRRYSPGTEPIPARTSPSHHPHPSFSLPARRSSCLFAPADSHRRIRFAPLCFLLRRADPRHRLLFSAPLAPLGRPEQHRRRATRGAAECGPPPLPSTRGAGPP